MLMGMLFDLTMSVVTLKLPFLVHTISKKENLYKFYLDNDGKKSEIHSIRMVQVYFVIENLWGFIMQDISMYVGIKTYFLGSFGNVTVSHANETSIS